MVIDTAMGIFKQYIEFYNPSDYENYEDDRGNMVVTGQPLTNDKDRMRFYQSLNADTAIWKFGDSSKFTAFVYSDNTNTLYCHPGNKYHGEMKYDDGDTEMRKVYDEPKGGLHLFGRFGKTERGGSFITVWNTVEEDEYDIKRYDLKVGDTKVLKKMLRAMVDGTAKIVGESPAEYPLDPNAVYTDFEGVVEVVKDLIGYVGKPQVDQTCAALAKLNIRGRDVSLGTAWGDMHMVKGPELEYIRTAICTNAARLKGELQKSGCKAQASMLDDMIARASCPSREQEWGQRKQGGADMYRADLRKIFDDPDEIDKNFRTQKEIDAAWDYLNKREQFSFRKWLRLVEFDESEKKIF